MVYKLAPDWYFLEAANMAAGNQECHFKTLEIAKEESEKYRKEELAKLAGGNSSEDAMEFAESLLTQADLYRLRKE